MMTERTCAERVMLQGRSTALRHLRIGHLRRGAQGYWGESLG